jgi:NADPH-dependent 2,4-dienoyl-CoA reductase/sulfur reductase-like enzyme
VELAEAAIRRGKRALLFDVTKTSVASYYDPEFSTEMDKALSDGGVELHFGEAITAIEGTDKVTGVSTDAGAYDVEMVLLCIGFKPNTALGKDDLQLFPNNAYQVNSRQETSLVDVYAVGDCATVWNNATESRAYIALATNAVRSGLIAGHNACGTALETAGVQGSNGISVFGWNMFSTGLSLAAAQQAGFDAVYTEFEDLQKPGFITSNNNKVKLRIVYNKTDRRILGAQLASHQDVSMGIHMFSLAIAEKITIDKLALLDIFFLPHFNQPYNYITMAALSAK